MTTFLAEGPGLTVLSGRRDPQGRSVGGKQCPRPFNVSALDNRDSGQRPRSRRHLVDAHIEISGRPGSAVQRGFGRRGFVQRRRLVLRLPAVGPLSPVDRRRTLQRAGSPILRLLHSGATQPPAAIFTAVSSVFNAFQRRADVRVRPASTRVARPEGRGHRPHPAEHRSVHPLRLVQSRVWAAMEHARSRAGRARRQPDEVGRRRSPPARLLGDHRLQRRPISLGVTPKPRACRRYCRSGPPAFGSASCATARRTNCSRWPANTIGEGFPYQSSSSTISTGHAKASGSSTPENGPTPKPWWTN